MQGSNSTRRQPGRASHKAQEPALVCSIQLCQNVQEEADRSAGGSVAVVKLDGVGQSLHTPLFASAAHHGFDLILKEALEGIQGEDLVEASPACGSQGLSKTQPMVKHCHWAEKPGTDMLGTMIGVRTDCVAAGFRVYSKSGAEVNVLSTSSMSK